MKKCVTKYTYLKCNQQPLTLRADEIFGIRTRYHRHNDNLYDRPNTEQHHGMNISHCLDQRRADSKKSARYESKKYPKPLGTLTIIVTIVIKLFGVLIGRVDAVVRSRGFDVEFHGVIRVFFGVLLSRICRSLTALD